MGRVAKVNHVNVYSIEFSSRVQIGDLTQFDPTLVAIAVQQEGAVFTKEFINQYRFEDEPFFYEPDPLQLEKVPIDFINNSHSPVKVGKVNITGLTGSSGVQIGTLKHADASTKVKHTRILRDTSNEE